MNYFFVDFENVHSGGFEGIENYNKDDIIYLMYTENSQTISLTVLEKMLKKNVTNLRLIKVAAGGKNALDFQLSTYLGYLIAKTEDKKVGYYIISKDQGFDFIVKFWNGNGVPVRRITNFLPLKQRDSIPMQTVNAETQENSKAAQKENIEKLAAAEESKEIKQNNAEEKTAPENNKAAEKENTVKIAAAEENKKIKQNNTKEKTVAENKKAAKKENTKKVAAVEETKAVKENNAEGKPVAVNNKAVKKEIAKETNAIAKEDKKETVTKEKTKAAAAKPVSESKSGIASKKELLKYITDEEYTDRILEIINKYKTKVSIKNGFDKEYRNANVSGALYKKVRPYLKSIGKT